MSTSTKNYLMNAFVLSGGVFGGYIIGDYHSDFLRSLTHPFAQFIFFVLINFITTYDDLNIKNIIIHSLFAVAIIQIMKYIIAMIYE